MKAHCQLQWLPPTSTFERPRTSEVTRSNLALPPRKREDMAIQIDRKRT